MLLQFAGDDVFPHFLLDNIQIILVDFDDTIDFPVDIILEHVLNSHFSLLLITQR